MDWKPDMDDSESEGGVEFPKPSLEQLFQPPMEENIFLHHLKGSLPVYLSAVGWKTESEQAQVVRELEQYYPTFMEQTDKLYEILERELIEKAIGDGSTIIDDNMQFTTDETHFRINRQMMLLDVRQRRSEIRNQLFEADDFGDIDQELGND